MPGSGGKHRVSRPRCCCWRGPPPEPLLCVDPRPAPLPPPPPPPPPPPGWVATKPADCLRTVAVKGLRCL
ncbi:unnamed protein product [Closterium sp. NIES-53]